MVVVANADLCSASNHVVDLVLGVRALVIGSAGRDDVQADAEQLAPQNLGCVRIRRGSCLSDHALELRSLEPSALDGFHRLVLPMTLGFWGGLMCPSTYPAAIMLKNW